MTMKAFKKLTKDTVNIAVSETEYFTCPMLPVAHLPAFKEGLASLLSEDLEIQCEGRKALLELVKKVFPVEYQDKLYRLLPHEVAALSAVLMFGDDADEPDEGKKKLNLASPPQEGSSTASSQPAGSCGNTGGGSKRSWLSAILSSWLFKKASAEPGQTQP